MLFNAPSRKLAAALVAAVAAGAVWLSQTGNSLRQPEAGIAAKSPVAAMAAAAAPAAALPQGSQPAATVVQGGSAPTGIKIFGEKGPVSLGDVPAGRFHDELAKLQPPALANALKKLETMRIPVLDIGSLHADSNGNLFYTCQTPAQLGMAAEESSHGHFASTSSKQLVTSTGSQEGLSKPAAQSESPQKSSTITSGTAARGGSLPPTPISAPPIRHSKPGATKVIYLDFNGAVVAGTVWNSSLGVSSYNCIPYDTDGDRTTFNAAEQTDILRVWELVAEDYQPFDVDVTTEAPTTLTNNTAIALITRSTDASGIANPYYNSGGVAYVGVFGGTGFASYRPAFVYYDHLGTAENIAEASAHEIGHNLGLSHQGTSTSEYYYGHGTDATSWAPIMGAGYGKDVTQWSRGEYYAANNTQDAISIIAGKLTFRADDASDSTTGATALTADASNSFSMAGLIEKSTDVDVYSFTTTQPMVSIDVTPFHGSNGKTGGDLNCVVELLDANGTVLSRSSQPGNLDASVTRAIAPGTYYIRVSSSAWGTPLANPPTGFTVYGSEGAYTVKGRFGPALNARLTPVIGQALTLSGTVAGKAPVSCQWKKNGVTMAGATSASYPINAVSAADAGFYTLYCTDANGATSYATTYVIPRVNESKVSAWGNSVYGQTTVPANLTDAVSITAGANQLLALKADGTVIGWGYNANGAVTIPAGLTDVVSIVGGAYHAVALKSDGRLVAWGGNSSDQATVPADLTDVGAISTSGNFTLALKTDGTVIAFGSPGNTYTTVPDGLANVVAVAAGYSHALALKSNGTVVAWGDNSDGRATVPAGLTDVVAVAAGDNHSLALKSDGTVVAWGANTSSQTTIPAGLTNVVAISAGRAHSLAIKNDGTVIAWGANSAGQTVVPSGLINVLAIDAGSDFSAALNNTSLTPIISSSSATSVTYQSATLNGAVNPNGSPTTLYFEYGTTTAYGFTTASQSGGSGKTPAACSAAISGLADGTTYHWRLKASNNAGTAAGADQTFSTSTATTSLASLILSTGTFSPVFNASVFSYSATLPSTVSSLTLTPTKASVNSTLALQVNGEDYTSLASGVASATIPLKTGVNTIGIKVIAPGGASQVYTVAVTRLPNTNADLASLALSAGTLAPTFLSSVTSYTASVPNGAASVTVTPTAAASTSAIAVRVASGAFVAVPSGMASAVLPLNVGANLIEIQTTAEDGVTVKKTTLTITRAPSSNADLASLSISNGTLSPAFSPGVTSYSTSFIGTSLTVTPVPADATATLAVRLNGGAYSGITNGVASSALLLKMGSNTVEIRATAQDGSAKITTLTVTRLPASNADLAGLVPSLGSLSPAFSTGVTSYNVSVINTAASSGSSITVVPTASDSNATLAVRVNGGTYVSVTSGAACAPLALNVGTNLIDVKVTAEDGATVKFYTLTVTRPPSSNSDLAALALSSGTLSPGFSSSVTNYSASVENSVATLNVTAFAAEANASLALASGSGADMALVSGAPSNALPLNVGANVLTLKVTAQDGTSKIYTVTITRLLKANADLSSLTLSAGTLTPVFSPSVLAYTGNLANDISSLSVTPTTADSDATVTVRVNNATPIAVPSGSPSALLPLNVGNNTLTVSVTAQNGTTVKSTTLTLARAPSANADLASLLVSSGTLAPGFTASNTSYSLSVANSAATLSLTPTLSDTTATLQVKANGGTYSTVSSGVAGSPLALNVGANPVLLKVTAQDGSTVKIYTVTVTRQPSADADLSALTLSSGTLAPVFSPGVLAYSSSVNVPAITLTPTKHDNTSTVTVAVNGQTVTSYGTGVTGPSAALPLNLGANTLTVTVTAQDGTTVKVYSVAMTRLPSNNANLSGLTWTNSTLSPGFDANVTSYTAALSNGVGSPSKISVTPTAVEPQATIAVRVNGEAYSTVASGTPSQLLPLNVGANPIEITVTAPDGVTVKTYTLTITRAPGTNANLSALELSSGTLAPALNATATSYSATVAKATASITLKPTADDPDATLALQLNGGAYSPLASASTSPALPLTVGTNSINVKVTAQNGTTVKTYALTVVRTSLAGDADLAALSFSGGVISPAFSSPVTAYSSRVIPTLANATVTPVLSDSLASMSVRVNGGAATSVTSAAASNALALQTGTNAIDVTVTAQDGLTVKTYTLLVVRPVNTDASLDFIAISPGTLAPAFAPDTTRYTAKVANNVVSFYSATVFPTAAVDSNATIAVRVNGGAYSPVLSGAPSSALPLTVGTNAVDVTVTAQDGVTTKTYSIAVLRPTSSNANLSSLTLNAETLAPVVSLGGITTSGSVANSVTSVTVTPTTVDPSATLSLSINGGAFSPALSGTASAALSLVEGLNTLAVKVTSQDGKVTKTFKMAVNRALRGNADLASLSTNAGTLSPVFDASITHYTSSLTNSVSSLEVRAIPADSAATVKVQINGGAATVIAGSAAVAATRNATLTGRSKGAKITPTVPNKTASKTAPAPQVSGLISKGALSLNVGVNVIVVQVTAQDGRTVKFYTINVNRAAPASADLANLIVSAGPLTPVFDSATVNYNVPSVSNSTTSVTVKPTALDPSASVQVRINGGANLTVPYGATSADLPLEVGVNSIVVTVTSQDFNAVKTYTVTLTRLLKANADLNGLTVSAGALSPLFNSNIFSYTGPNLASTGSNVTVTATQADPDATLQVRVNGGDYGSLLSGVPSGPLSLLTGTNTVTVRVTAQDGTSARIYSITLVKAPSVNADLTSVKLSAGTLSPAFVSSNLSYSATVANSVTSLEVTPTAAESTASIYLRLDGVGVGYVGSGSVSPSFPLKVGANVVSLKVFAENGLTYKNYLISVVREASANADLSALVPSAGAITPDFSPSVTSYSLSLPISSLAVTPTRMDPNSTVAVRINGGVFSPIAADMSSGTMALRMGVNPIEVRVTAQNGTTVKTYTLNMTRVPSVDATLSSLTLSAGTIAPDFSASVTRYSLTTDKASTTVTPATGGLNAIIAVRINGGSYTPVNSGNSSASLPLNPGSNEIDVKVTAEDGVTFNTYSITVGRMTAPVTSPATNISLSSATLNGLVDKTYSTSAYFQYGTTTAYGRAISATVTTSGSSMAPASATVSGLSPATIYHYRIATTCGSGISYGSDQTFVTPQTIPSVSVASPGDAAPGVSNAVFATFGIPAINDAGQAAFRATLSGSGLLTTNNTGLWVKSGTAGSLIARTGDPAPGGGVFASFDDPVFNNHGEVAFLGTLQTGVAGVTAASATGIWTNTSGTLALVARTQNIAPGTASAKFASFAKLALPDEGGVLLLANLVNGVGGITSANNQGVWTVDANGQVIPVVFKGDRWVVNGVTKTVTTLSIFAPATAAAGQTRNFNRFSDLTFNASFNDGSRGVFAITMPEQEISAVMLNNDLLPDLLGVGFSTFGNPAINDTGDAAFQAVIWGDGITSLNNSGIWISTVAGEIKTVARSGEAAPGGGFFATFDNPLFNNNGQTAFIGTLQTGNNGVTAANATGIWATTGTTATTGTLALVAKIQGDAPGCGGATFESFVRLVLPDQGGMVLLANLAAGTSEVSGQGVWALNANGQLQLLARTGDSFLVNGVAKTVSSLTIFSASDVTSGQTRSFNQSGDLIYRVTFTDGTQSIQAIQMQ